MIRMTPGPLADEEPAGAVFGAGDVNRIDKPAGHFNELDRDVAWKLPAGMRRVGRLCRPGSDLLAWVLPLGGIALGAVGLAAALGTGRGTRAARRRRRRSARAGARGTSAASTRSSRASMLEKLPVAFLAGLLSVVTPCVLPLVPGYLSAVSAVDVDRLGERGVGRRVVRASLPFILGFTVVFVVLGAGAAAIGSVVAKPTQIEIAGFVLVVIGLAFIGLLPLPERAVAPGLLQRARGRGSASCSAERSRSARRRASAPCSRRSSCSRRASGTIARGVVLLVAYSLGLGAAFVARRGRVRARDARLPLGARPLRRRAGRLRRRRSSRSGCCSSSTATGGCASRSTRCSRGSGSARSSARAAPDVETAVRRLVRRKPPQRLLRWRSAATVRPRPRW